MRFTLRNIVEKVLDGFEDPEASSGFCTTRRFKCVSLYETLLYKKWQATYITLLQPCTLAAFPLWGIKQELVV